MYYTVPMEAYVSRMTIYIDYNSDVILIFVFQ